MRPAVHVEMNFVDDDVNRPDFRTIRCVVESARASLPLTVRSVTQQNERYSTVVATDERDMLQVRFNVPFHHGPRVGQTIPLDFRDAVSP